MDDSETVRQVITEGLSGDPQIEVIGGASDPYQARELLLEFDPDVICLDIIMPRMDGITFLRKLFMYKPKPVIVISSVAQKGSKLRQQALDIGAVDVLDKEELKIYSQEAKVSLMLPARIKAAAAAVLDKK